MAAIAAAVPLLTPSSHAQNAQASTGVIRGRVLNATNGMYLMNARVTLDGSTQEAFTNQFGEYVLEGVPAGAAQLRVTYTGQTPFTTAVTVESGKTALQNITFNATTDGIDDEGTLVLNEFTVAANRFRNAQELAINEQRNSVNIKNVISVDQFGDIPSGNVGELVKFLPGVQVDYGTTAGVNSGYSDSDASTISVRGFGPEDTAILIDGMPVASSVPGSLSRLVTVDQLSINNASRVELIKVPTPDMPANSNGGQLNLITKSAFEYARPSYSARLYFNINSLTADFEKTPGPANKSTYKTQPGLELTITKPFSSTFGVSFTGSAANESTITRRVRNVYTYTGAFTNQAGQTPSVTNPALNRYQLTDTPRLNERRSGNLRLDWKPTPSQVLKANVQYSTYESTEAQRNLDFRPVIAAGADWGPTFVNGVSGTSGTTAMTVTTRDRIGNTKSAQIQYSFIRSGWNIAAAVSRSISDGKFVDDENGHYSDVALNLNPGRVEISEIKDGIPRRVATYWRTNATNGLAGQPKDYSTLRDWSFDGTTAKSGESFNRGTTGLYKLDLERDLNFIPFLGSNALSLKAGLRRDEDKQEKWGRGSGYRQILRPGKSYTVSDILDEGYIQSPGFGMPDQQWISTYKLYELNKQLDLFYEPDFDEATNTRVENYNSYVNQQKSVTETKDAGYAMLSGRFFNNRLSLVGGVRQERVKREGRAPGTDSKWNFLRRPDGTVYTDATNPGGVMIDIGNGSISNDVIITQPTNRPLFQNTTAGIALRQSLTSQGIPFPTLPLGPSTNSLKSRMLQLIPNKPFSQKRTGDPSYSLSSAFQVTKKIDFKAAWSRTFGLPKLEDGANGIASGNNTFTINEYTDTEQITQAGANGQITVANPGLKPTTSDNWDFSTSYYTDSGGIFSTSYYRKNVTNQVQNFTTYSGTETFNAILAAIGLDSSAYQDWRVVTSTNSNTDQKTSGWEFEVRQDLRVLGNWGKRFQGFLSYSFTNLADPATPAPYSITAPNGSVVTLVPAVSTIDRRANKFGGAGLQYSGDRFSAQIRGTYRNEDEDPQFTRVILPNGNLLRRYSPEETRIDVTLNYVLNKHFSLFLSGRDVLNSERKLILRDDQGLLPEHAELSEIKEFGVVWSTGVNAKF